MPCAEHRLAAEPRLWRPEVTLSALCHTLRAAASCQPQVSFHQLLLHGLRQHADVMWTVLWSVAAVHTRWLTPPIETGLVRKQTAVVGGVPECRDTAGVPV